jgi:hypothetical protein
MDKFDGYLFAKLKDIGSWSEGPQYFLQLFDYDEIPIIKHVDPWEDDPELHSFLGSKVSIQGELDGNSIAYENIVKFIG